MSKYGDVAIVAGKGHPRTSLATAINVKGAYPLKRRTGISAKSGAFSKAEPSADGKRKKG